MMFMNLRNITILYIYSVDYLYIIDRIIKNKAVNILQIPDSNGTLGFFFLNAKTAGEDQLDPSVVFPKIYLLKSGRNPVLLWLLILS